MSDNHGEEGAGAQESSGDEIITNQVEISHVDSKEDMFVDAMDDLNGDNSRGSQSQPETDTEEVSSSVSVEKFSLHDNGPQDKHQEEREIFVREIAGLCYQLKGLTEEKQLFRVENNGEEEEVGDSDVSLRDCSKYLKIAVEERLQSESTIRELNAVLCMKDRVIEDLNAKVAELSVSLDVAASYMSSVEKVWSRSAEESSEVQLEKDRQIEVVTDRVLANLAMVVYQEELLDNSVGGKIAHVEKNTYLLIERYNWMLYEIDQLRQCLSKVDADLRVHEEFGMVFAAARDELIELKTRDVELVEKLSHLEHENMNLVERIEKEKVAVETANAELGKTKIELEQEKTRCVNTKEKLSMAVTKGKALVQQRDSLKRSLAEKTSELEKCLTELQEKSSALEAAELCKGELVKCENLAASLQETLSQSDAVLEKFGEILSLTSLPEELQSTDIIEKLKWLVDERNVMMGCKEELGKWENLAASLQEMLSQRNAILENFEEILSQTSVPEELQSRDIIEKLKWLVDDRNVLAGCKEELVNWENLVTSLQEMISQRNAILKNLEEILAQTSVPEELQSVDIIDKLKWLVDETNVLKNISLEFDKLKNFLSLVDPPDTVSSSDFESRVGWLKESYDQAKDEIKMLQDEIARTNEAAQNEIGRLSASLSVEVQEKDYLRDDLGDLRSKYNEVVEKEHHVKLERDNMVRMLLEGSGITTEDQEGVYHNSSDLAVLIDKCFGKIKERSSASIDTPFADAELFERIQSLLYVKDQELMLCEKLLEEELLVRSQVNDLSNELRAASQELATLNEEKGCLQQDLERLEEKSALLRDKLSMAVKKGKGLFQDRENLKRQLDEKNSEFEKLRLELQQQESTVSEYRDQINRLSADLEGIPKLEGNLIAVKDQRDQLEQFLLKSNNMLQSVIESIDGIVLPVDSVFQEPVEKVNWFAGYVSECQNAKTQAEQELGKVKEEASTLAGKLAEVQSTMKSLEDALSVAENNFSQLAEEKKQIEVDKANVELELQEAIEAARSQTSKFAEAFAGRKSVEDALSLAENNISVLINEKEEAQASRASTETELEKMREEVDIQTSKLTEAYKMIKSLEDALSQVETNVALLTEQNNDAHVGRTNLEDELKKLKDEAESQASKLANACTTIKSLEEALSKAENDISVLEGEKAITEQEVSVLNSKLNACMEELAGTSGSLESRSIELMGHLNYFQMLMKDESLLSIVKKCFEKKFESLKEMDLILKNMEDHFVDTVSEALQNHPVMEDDLHVKKPFSDDVDNVVNVGMENGEVNAASVDNISSCFRKTVEGFQMRNKIIAAKFEGFSTSTDEFIAALLRKLQATRDEVINMFEHMESLKQKVKNMEIFKQEQEKALAMLENDVAILQSACTDATRQLQFEVKNNLLELSSVPELENLNHGLFPEVREVGGADTLQHQQSPEGSKYVKTAEKLLFASRAVQNLTKLFESTSNVAAATIQDLQKNLKDTRIASEKAIEERDLNQNRVSQLEAVVEALQNSCTGLRLEVEDYQDKVDKLKEKEAELSSLYNSLLKKEQEAEDSLMSVSQVKILFDKISGIEIPFAEREVGELEPHGSAHVKKLFYIIDSVSELQHQINFLSHDKEELQSTLSAKIIEIEHLNEEVETQIRNKPELATMKNELLELTSSLEKIIDMLGGNEFVGDQKSAGVKDLLTVLEKQVMTLLLEVENSKYKAQELGSKLLGSQQVVDDLSTKVKVLEDSLQGRTVQPEIVQERSIFEAPSLPTGSEISEIEDVGSLGKNSISPVPSAAHVRTMRKGSADHLAINIDSESARLINNEETDEDKGHTFKSLNTSGLIPKQGKLIADRIDGIWVSGGRVLMNRPRARLGFIAYWLFLHLWLLGTIL